MHMYISVYIFICLYVTFQENQLDIYKYFVIHVVFLWITVFLALRAWLSMIDVDLSENTGVNHSFLVFPYEYKTGDITLFSLYSYHS
jgi:hypothetical protein